MTAANVFARTSGAWLFFDTASYDDDGFVRGFGPKVATSDRLSLAIGLCGRPPVDWLQNITAWLDDQPLQADAIAGLPSLLSSLSANASAAPNRARWWERRAWKTGTPANVPGIRLLVAWWNAEKGIGEGGVITDVDDLGPAYLPFKLHSVTNLTSPSPDFGAWFDFDDDLALGLDFDPVSDGATLGEFERRQPNERGGYRVGGAFERWHVHADGIDRETVLQWPDRIGRPIKVAA